MGEEKQQFKSSYIFRALGGEYNPFRPNLVDVSPDFIQHRKRNWHLVSVDSRKYHFQNVVGVDIDKHLFGATIIIEGTGNKNIRIKGLSKRTADTIADISAEHIKRNTQRGTTEAMAEAISKAVSQSRSGGGMSVADELKKLKELVDSGVLTQDEFDAQKNKLMSS